jgi:hypothetical protein
VVATNRRGTRDEENPDSDYRRCRAGECRCRAWCDTRAKGGSQLKVLTHGAVDGGEALMVRPPGRDVGSLQRADRHGGRR